MEQVLRSPVLVGRGHELRSLVDAVRRPRTLAVIEGEDGVGKTRLVEELLADLAANGRRALVGRSEPMRDPFPLGAVLEALHGIGGEPFASPPGRIAGALTRLLPELSAHLPPELTPLPDPRAELHRTFRAILDVLAAVGPAVLVLDDVHWADAATIDLLGFLVRRPPPDLSVVLTSRRLGDAGDPLPGVVSGAPGEAVRRISLGPLDRDDVRTLIGGLLGTDAISDSFVQHIYDWTSGIPYLVEEVVQLMRDRDPMLAATGCPGGALDRLSVPPVVRDAFLARLAPLSPDARMIVSAAAVLGSAAVEELVTAVAGLDGPEGANALSDAIVAGALTERTAGRYGFRHELGAKAVYEAIPGPRRRRLHLRAARALEARPRPQLVQIAHHLRQGDATKWPLYAEAAAKVARDVGDDRLATRLLEDALTAPNLSRPSRVRMAIGLCDAAVFGTASPRALGVLRRMVQDEVLPADVRGALRFSISILLGHAGDDAWRSEAVQAVGELQDRPELQVHAMMNLAHPARRAEGNLDDEREWLERATETLERCHDPVTVTAANVQRAEILLSLGDRAGWSAVSALPRRGRGPDETLHLLRGYHSVAMAALTLGYHRRAQSFLAAADTIHAELGNPWWDLWLGTAHACFDWVAGRWHGLEARLRDLRRDTIAIPALTVGNECTLGSLLLARGRLPEARRTLTGALETAREAKQLWPCVSLTGRLARVHLELDDPEAAREMTERGLDALRRMGTWVPGRSLIPEATEALIGCGELHSAQLLVDEYAARLHGLDSPAGRAALALCRGAVAGAAGRRHAAERHYAGAEEGWAALPHPLEAARARARRARCLDEETNGERRELLCSALNAFEELGALGDAGRVRAHLRAMGAWRGGRKGYGDMLSPREAEVARLAAEGMTNREIAATLVISPRTVEAHVAALLRKLSLASRDDIASMPGLEEKIGTTTHS